MSGPKQVKTRGISPSCVSKVSCKIHTIKNEKWIYCHIVNFELTEWLSYCKFCIYAHPVNSKFTIWHYHRWICTVKVDRKSGEIDLPRNFLLYSSSDKWNCLINDNKREEMKNEKDFLLLAFSFIVALQVTERYTIVTINKWTCLIAQNSRVMNRVLTPTHPASPYS